jgi:hypothetical protein
MLGKSVAHCRSPEWFHSCSFVLAVVGEIVVVNRAYHEAIRQTRSYRSRASIAGRKVSG